MYKKGFALDDVPLKCSDDENCFNELLEGIGDIRSSEKFFGEKCLEFMQGVLIIIQEKKV